MTGSAFEDDSLCLGIGNTNTPMGDAITGQRPEILIRPDNVNLNVRNKHLAKQCGDFAA